MAEGLVEFGPGGPDAAVSGRETKREKDQQVENNVVQGAVRLRNTGPKTILVQCACPTKYARNGNGPVATCQIGAVRELL